MKTKTRVRVQHFMDGSKKPGDKTAITSAFVVEMCVSRRWLPYGGDGKIARYKTREDAQKVADEIGQLDVVQG